MSLKEDSTLLRLLRQAQEERKAVVRDDRDNQPAKRTGRPEYNERRGDHVWTEGDRKSPVKAMRSDYWSYEPIGNVQNYRTNPKEAPQ